MKKKHGINNRFTWSGVAGGLGSVLIYFVGANLPVAVASGVALFAAGSVLFKKKNENTGSQMPTQNEYPSILESGREDVKTMFDLANGIEDERIREKATAVNALCQRIITVVETEPLKLQKSVKLFTYYVPTINKTLSIYRKLETSDTDHKVYETTLTFLDDCEKGLRKHIENLSNRDITEMSAEMETMTHVMGLDGLVDSMTKHSK